RKTRTVAFVDQAGLKNLQNLIKAYRPYDNAFARDDVDHALYHQAIQCLMDGCSANFQHRRELKFVDVLARPDDAGDDAMLEGIIGRMPQRSCGRWVCVGRLEASPASSHARFDCSLWHRQAFARKAEFELVQK